MEFLFNYTSLNKDICNITFQYINYSIENLSKIKIKNKNNTKNTIINIKNGLTISDILVMCVNLGYSGFYITVYQVSLANLIDKHIKIENETNNIIIKKISKDNILYHYKTDKNVNCISLLCLGVIEFLVKTDFIKI
jgi:hypothetical protein